VKRPPNTEECETCDGWGTITCGDCDGDGHVESSKPVCKAIWLDMTVEPFTEQRCDRKDEPPSALSWIHGVWLCAEHQRQITWGKQKGLRLRGGRLVAA